MTHHSGVALILGKIGEKNGKTVPKNVPETAVHQGVEKRCFVAFTKF